MRRGTTTAVALALALLAGACSGGDAREDATGGPDRTGTGTDAGATAAGGGCDPVDTTACLLPWPNDRFTRRDPATPTGLRLDLPAEGMPANAAGVRIDPAEWNRNDGFSPSSIGLVVVPGVDPEASSLPPVTDMGRSLRDDSPLTVLDLDTGRRVMAWAEVDPSVPEGPRRPLRVVPATALAEGHRHAVALTGLRTPEGEVTPTPAMRKVLERPDADARTWLAALRRAGVATDAIDVAWTFTVASGESLSGRLRAMWAETAKALGDGAPPFTVTSTSGPGAVRTVRGTFEMPRYLTGDGGPGSVLDNADDPDGIPRRNGTMTNEFTCMVPVVATGGPAAFVVYGHGLLGDRSEVEGIGGVGAGFGVGFCAVDQLGMSTADVPTVVEEFTDLTKFRTQPDRMLQGHLGTLLLGRLLASAEGFNTHPAFWDDDAARTPLVDPRRLSFLGASQGGILGAAPSSVTSDWDRTVLAVGGMGYNLLLRRSIDFDRFAGVLAENYPDPLERALALEVIQLLWDRGENTGYSQHLTSDPYDLRDEPQTVLLLEAFGDHQVANVSTEKLARTLGVPRRAPTLAEGRSPDVEPFAGIDPVPSFPWPGSALVVWDFGTPAPPTANVPPRDGEDPHGKLNDVPAALGLVVGFVQPDGTVEDVCGEGPCRG